MYVYIQMNFIKKKKKHIKITWLKYGHVTNTHTHIQHINTHIHTHTTITH